MRHIIPQFVESGILSLPTPLDDATQGAFATAPQAPALDPVAHLLSMVFGFRHLKPQE